MSRGGGWHAGGAVSQLFKVWSFVSGSRQQAGFDGAGRLVAPSGAAFDAGVLAFFRDLGTHARGGMGQCRPSAARRHGARDGIPSGLSRACVVCASSLPCGWPCCSPASMVCEHCAARHVERPSGQGARAGCAQGGRTRPSTRVAAVFARSGPPASLASDASRGPFCMREKEVKEPFFTYIGVLA